MGSPSFQLTYGWILATAPELMSEGIRACLFVVLLLKPTPVCVEWGQRMELRRILMIAPCHNHRSWKEEEKLKIWRCSNLNPEEIARPVD